MMLFVYEVISCSGSIAIGSVATGFTFTAASMPSEERREPAHHAA
jgi:hypothetical protein